MLATRSTADLSPEASASQDAGRPRRSWGAALRKGLPRDILIGTLGFVFGSVLIGIDAAIPTPDERASAQESAGAV